VSPEPKFGERFSSQYSFGDFTLDLDNRVLRRAGQEVNLRPKSLDVLAHLVQRHGSLVTKLELMETVWPGTAVTDNSLAQCVVEIRRTLDDDSQRLIRTLARRGYVFAAPVSRSIAEPPRHAEPGPLPVRPSTSAQRPAKRSVLMLGALGVLGLAFAALRLTLPAGPKPDGSYVQITNFTDSAIAPALSPDGRMVAFLRSDRWFLSPDQIYLKLLPDGEPVQLTHDRRQKYGMAFSPDGSRLAYTVFEGKVMEWNTHTISVLGGEPSLLLSNASGLTWLNKSRFLFSEQDGKGAGAHMGIATAGNNRENHRQIYFPTHERAMAHFSYASPDRKWALVVEMDPIWHPCRVVPLDGTSSGRQVGPNGQCLSAAWSPDGKWMYFGVEVGGAHHLWQQRFPHGTPEQITHGASQEDGVVVAPDGRSLITSIGIERSDIWIHDARGERPLYSQGSLEGMHVPSWSSIRFSSDGKSIFYLMRRDSPQSPSELWRTDLESGNHEAVLRHVSILGYDLSSDNREVVFSAQSSEKVPPIWLAPLDRSTPPRLVAPVGGAWPVFGPRNQVLYLQSDGKANHLVRIGKDASGQSTVVPYPVGNIDSISPDRQWIVVLLQSRTVALPTAGGHPRPIYRVSTPAVTWSADGRFFYIGVQATSLTSLGKTVALPVPSGQTFPELPAEGILGLEEAKALSGARILDGWNIAPGPDPSVYAFIKTTVHRNLYRVPVR
jgi:DNA-binding winged helix-turn-helix (wHTH) protein/Tol biopolymer transport system component